jgi:GntR family transcriptional regulator
MAKTDFKMSARYKGQNPIPVYYRLQQILRNQIEDGHRVQGSGTFVAGTTLRRESLRYYRLLRDFHDEHANLGVELLAMQQVEGRSPHNKYLQLEEADGLFEMERIFQLEGTRLIYTISFMPQKMFKGLLEYPTSLFEKVTLYEFLEDKYGVTTVYNQELFGIAQADEKVSEILGVKPGHSLLFMEMLSFTYKGMPYEYRHSYFLSDNRKIFVEI